MKKLSKWISLALVMVLLLSLFGCGKKASPNKNNAASVDLEPYIGTWRASNHNGERVVHYIIFDENGYWNVYMNYTTLLKAIKQLPNQLVSFKKFCELQNSDHTGCYYEYVEDSNYTDIFYIEEDGRMLSTEMDKVFLQKVSEHSGEPDADVVAEARDLFDRALVEAHSK